MKPKQLLGVILIAACIITAGLALRGTVRRSLTVQEVMASEGEPCGLYGEVVKGSDEYDMKTARLTFNLKDPKGDAIPVVYNKPKPANFEQASHVKAVGAYRDGAFHADELVLKCPSKYITDPPAPGKSTPKNDPYTAFRKGA
jgi:cytochrome c-type biogenesis protein CcmE